ncbi:MAG TPA: VOC family protein [Devosia sp.]|nr:VOC family protein [Devosia sp.]
MAKIIKKIAHACIFAHDLEATEQFYRDVLGIEVVFRFMKAGKLIGYYLDAGGATHIEVFHKAEAAFTETSVINHICLEVTNMDEAVAQVRARGVKALDKKLGVDGTWQSWLTDPNGVKIELFEYTDNSLQFIGGVCEVTW